MKEGYKVNPTIGSGLFIEVYNYIGLNEIGQYRYTIPVKRHTKSMVGMWKLKQII